VSERRRVVITGIGPVTPVGIGIDDFWAGLTSGRNGVREITRFDTTDLPVVVAGEVDGFDPADFLDAKETRRTDPFTHYAISAASLAWTDAGTPQVVSAGSRRSSNSTWCSSRRARTASRRSWCRC
jgi:3-oxoacyl-[acyl-carrier-protein] synthase II